MTSLLAFLLIAEALLTAVWCAQLAPNLVAYPWSVAVLAGCRGMVAALQFAAGMMLFRAHPAGRAFGRVAFVSSAGLLTLELGAALAPSNLFPSYRWPVVAAYAAYAMGAVWLLREPRTSGRE